MAHLITPDDINKVCDPYNCPTWFDRHYVKVINSVHTVKIGSALANMLQYKYQVLQSLERYRGHVPHPRPIDFFTVQEYTSDLDGEGDCQEEENASKGVLLRKQTTARLRDGQEGSRR